MIRDDFLIRDFLIPESPRTSVATITPRAITFAVKDALIYFDKNKDKLFNHPANCEAL